MVNDICSQLVFTYSLKVIKTINGIQKQKNKSISGKELRELLASKGILQKDIARQLNMTPGGFSQQLRAKDIKTGLLESICKVLNVKMDFFYGGTEYLEGYELIKQSDLKEFKSKLDQIHTCCNEISEKLS